MSKRSDIFGEFVYSGIFPWSGSHSFYSRMFKCVKSIISRQHSVAPLSRVLPQHKVPPPSMLPKRMIFAQFGTLLSKNEVYDNIAENVFSIKLNTHNAEVQYSRHGDVYDLIYTNLPEQFRGQNLGHILAERIFDHLVERKKKIKITCEFLQFFYEKNKAKYKDFVVEQ